MNGFGGVLGYLRATWQRRHFWFSLARLDLKMRYHGSVFGVAWSLFQPLASTAIYCIIFGSIFKAELRGYIPYLLSGLAAWNFIAASLVEGCDSIHKAEKYMRVYPAPIAIYGLRTLCSQAFHFLVILAIAIGFSWILLGFGNLPYLPALVPALGVFVVFAWSVIMIFGIIDVYFPDNKHMLQIILQLLFYTVPIIYPPDLMTNNMLRTLIQHNPLNAMINLLRDPIVTMQLPSNETWLVALATSLTLFTFACFLIGRTERYLILHL
jgi:lipopolysaccharide transport system permease protein